MTGTATEAATAQGGIRRPRRRSTRPWTPLQITGVIMVVGAVGFSLVYPLLGPYDPLTQSLGNAFLAPGADPAHLLGTDQLGRDIASRLALAGRVTLSIVIGIIIVNATVGLVLGIVAGYAGGKVDSAIMGLADVQLALPVLLVLIALAAALSPSVYLMIIVLAATFWVGYARVARAVALSLAGRDFVLAPRIQGAGPAWILSRHIVPNAATQTLILAATDIGAVILLTSSFDFLGLGVQAPTPSWGVMISDGQAYLRQAPWLALIPGFAILLVVAGTNLVSQRFTSEGSSPARGPSRGRLSGPKAGPTAQLSAATTATAVEVGAVSAPGAPDVEAGPIAALATDPPGREDGRESAESGRDEVILAVRDLTVGYATAEGDIVILVDHVSFDLRQGEVLCIVGESGSGKSVTMLAVMGLLPPGLHVLDGSVRYRGRDVLAMSERERRALRGSELAMVFQDPMTALNPVKRVGDQIERTIAVHNPGLSRAVRRERVAQLLARVGVPQPAARARSYPHEWSGGMRQRAVIAMAMANQPALLVADEPTTALDTTIQAQVMEVLAESRAESGAAMVMITHDLGLVAEIADQVCILYSGRVVEAGTVWQVFDAPRHPYTRGLLASLLTTKTQGQRAFAIPGSPPAPASRPSGCAFAPRCDFSGKSEACHTAPPELEFAGSGHGAACYGLRVREEVSAR